MRVIDLLDAKTNLSKLVDAVESGSEGEVVIDRNGNPAARLVAVTARRSTSKRIGLFGGKYPPMSLEDFNAKDEETERLFYGEDD